MILANFGRIPFLFQNLFTQFYSSNRLPVRSCSIEVWCNKEMEAEAKVVRDIKSYCDFSHTL